MFALSGCGGVILHSSAATRSRFIQKEHTADDHHHDDHDDDDGNRDFGTNEASTQGNDIYINSLDYSLQTPSKSYGN